MTTIPIWRAAADLVAGDRIAAGFLPDGDAAKVLFVRTHTLHNTAWTFVAYEFADAAIESSEFLADGKILLEPDERDAELAKLRAKYAALRARVADLEAAAAPTTPAGTGPLNSNGFDYGRDADDPTPVSPARRPMHTGAMTDAGLVDETDARQAAWSALGMGYAFPPVDETPAAE